MNSKVKGVLQVLLVLVLIAAFAFVAARGIVAHTEEAQRTFVLDWIWKVA